MKISDKEKEILRRLAGRYSEIARSDANAGKKLRLYDLNSLKSKEPVILAYPEGAWGELLPQKEILCEDPVLKGWEWGLRSRIYTAEIIKDDQAFEPYFNLGWSVNYGDYGVPVAYEYGADRGSFRWDPPLKDLRTDMKKLRFREPVILRDETAELKVLAESVFKDILPVRIRGQHWWSFGMTRDIIKLVGLDNMMLLMYDDPEGLHSLMAWMRDEWRHFMHTLEAEGVLTDQNEDDYTGSGGVGYTRELPQRDRIPGSPARLKDLWGFAESQETVGVSPEMFAEFIFPYQLPLLEMFGLNCYGCCEGLHLRAGELLKIPRLRRVSVSPWADQRIMAERLRGRAVFSRKPNPAMICSRFHEDEIRADIRTTLEAAGGQALEIIMKDTHTVQNDPDRISRWVGLARDEARKFLH